MPLARRLPKRGFSNYPFKKNIVIVNLDSLKAFPAGSVVDPDTLRERGIIRKSGDGVKVLGKGSIDHALTLKVHAVSDSARKKIEASGGTVEVM